jgi:hypothetical protein
MIASLINPAVLARADAIGQEFASAMPYRHVVIDSFFAPDYADALLAQFPAFDNRRALNEAGLVGNKAVVEHIREIGAHYAALDDLVKAESFLRLVYAFTGIPDLRYDPHYFGGGTHENRSGQDLDPHIDFNKHPLENWHRRLNLIVYLNPEWQDAWGGSLEIHSDPYAPDNRVKLITPIFNRCVIFETNEISWHGFSRINATPGVTRKSIALYFYTSTRPAEELSDTHSTIYVDRPLPAHWIAGHTLSADDVDTMQLLVARRDQHNQRLYRDLTALQKQLELKQTQFEQLYASLSKGKLGRMFYFARRVAQYLRR